MCAAPRARADDAVAKARLHEAQGAKHFNLGAFEQAVHHYQEAYKAKPLPFLLYNIGQCHKRMPGLRHKERAQFFFESYLNNAPDAANRAEVQAEIAALKKQIAATRAARQQQRPTAKRPATQHAATAKLQLHRQAEPPPEPASKPLWKKWWFWTSLVAVAAGAAVGIAIAASPEGTHMPQGPKLNFADFQIVIP